MPVRYVSSFAFSAMIFLGAMVGPSQANDEALEASIAKLGGSVERDQTRPDHPIVKVNLAGTKANDAILKSLAKLPHLVAIDLQETQVTNAGLKLLQDSTSLGELNLANTKVSEAAQKTYQTARNQVRVTRVATLNRLRARAAAVSRNGFVVAVDQDEEAGTISCGFQISIDNVSDREIQQVVEQFPEITNFSNFQASLSDNAYAHIGRLSNLDFVSAGGIVRDANVLALSGKSKLKTLSINSTKIFGPTATSFTSLGLPPTITDAAFVNAKSWPNLESIRVNAPGELGKDRSGNSIFGSPISDRTFLNLAKCTKLKSIAFTNCLITDAGVKALTGLADLESLTLSGGRLITDASVPAFSSMRKLTYLGVGRTGLTPAGIAAITRALPDTMISVD